MPTVVGTEEIKRILCEVYTASHEATVTPDQLGDDEALFDFEGTGAETLEFDSLDGLEAIAALEDAYGVMAPADIDPRDMSTPRRITDFVNSLLREASGS